MNIAIFIMRYCFIYYFLINNAYVELRTIFQSKNKQYQTLKVGVNIGSFKSNCLLMVRSQYFLKNPN